MHLRAHQRSQNIRHIFCQKLVTDSTVSDTILCVCHRVVIVETSLLCGTSNERSVSSRNNDMSSINCIDKNVDWESLSVNSMLQGTLGSFLWQLTDNYFDFAGRKGFFIFFYGHISTVKSLYKLEGSYLCSFFKIIIFQCIINIIQSILKFK